MSTAQFTESNLNGLLVSGIDETATTILVKFFDKITGLPRIPEATTKLFVIDKGSVNAPNTNYEIVLASSHVTVSDVTTITVATNGRGLYFYGNSLTGSGTGNSHVANAEIGTADVHYLWNILANKLSGGEALGSALNFDVRPVFSGSGIFGARIFADDTARDAAITAPQNGDVIYNTFVGLPQKYVAGTWIDDTSGGAVPNASEIVAGKVELATNAEMRLGTSTGGTGARLVPPNDQLVATSSGAGDQGKIATLGADGGYANGFLINAGFTGEIKMWITSTAPTGWLLCEGGTIGSATSGGTARANADTVTLYTLLWDNFADAQLAVTGGRGASAAADFAANKKIALPDLRGRVAVGLNASTFNLNGKIGGEETHVLITAEMPAHSHTASLFNAGTTANAFGSGPGAATGTGTTSSVGSGTAHNNLQPYWVSRFIIKY
jgi:microcystin-dependent protein